LDENEVLNTLELARLHLQEKTGPNRIGSHWRGIFRQSARKRKGASMALRKWFVNFPFILVGMKEECEDFHLLRKLFSGLSCTIQISNRQMVNGPGLNSCLSHLFQDKD